MKFKNWLQINEKHEVLFPRENTVKVLFEIYFKYFNFSLLKDNYGYEFYLTVFKWTLRLAQNKTQRMKEGCK